MATFEIIFIIALIALQIIVFANVLKKIGNFKKFFPDTSKIKIKRINEGTAKEPDSLDLLDAPIENEHFNEIIESTNDYLRKNKGAAADFGILKDISERHLEKFDNEIGNLINVPLYIGLGGTFFGIIIGLFGISFPNTTTTVAIISTTSINQLLNGVITAMCASLAGLIFTVINSVVYKSAAYKTDTDKNNYYDLLQRELLPNLNTGIARSLGTFKDVLNHFIQKFGENMDDYMVSGEMLNENLSKQQFVLEEINKLSLTRTSTKIAETFVKLQESSEHLAKFIDYQKGLNNYVDKTEKVTQEMKSIIEKFTDFNLNLKVISDNTIGAIELQKQFKDSLEKHFPTINDHREVWRQQIDELNLDVKNVYQELYNYFKEQTEQVKRYVENNNDIFSGIKEVKKAVQVFVENSNVQKEEFSLLQEQIVGLRNDFKEAQQTNIETNIKLINAIKDIKKDAQKESIETNEALLKVLKELNTSIGKIGKMDKFKEN
jgi:biopolymer transport protein ExbB/TolQ